MSSKFDVSLGQPIIFELPGHSVDTKIKVFQTEFHVHSLILKLGSAYFRTFLDSPDKIPAASSARFRYDYGTAIDADGQSWGLETVSKIQEKPGELVTYKEDETAQTAAFMHILRAIYRHPPMDVSKVEELIPLTELADFYCTLPSVSIALDGVMLRNLQSRWGANIRDNLDVYVRVATKLRNKTLFKECMVHVVSLWNSKLEKHISLLLDLIKDHPKIWKLAKNAHECICAKIDTVNQAIAKIIGYDDGNRPTETKLELAMPQAQRLVVADRAQYHMRMWSGSDFKTFASYYRSLLEDPFEITKVHIRDNCAWYLISKGKECSDDIAKQVHAAVRPLFEKNLVLDDSDDGAGQGIYKDCFLCAEISDEDLPWDVDQIEW